VRTLSRLEKSKETVLNLSQSLYQKTKVASEDKINTPIQWEETL